MWTIAASSRFFGAYSIQKERNNEQCEFCVKFSSESEGCALHFTVGWSKTSFRKNIETLMFHVETSPERHPTIPKTRQTHQTYRTLCHLGHCTAVRCDAYPWPCGFCRALWAICHATWKCNMFFILSQIRCGSWIRCQWNPSLRLDPWNCGADSMSSEPPLSKRARRNLSAASAQFPSMARTCGHDLEEICTSWVNILRCDCENFKSRV